MKKFIMLVALLAISRFAAAATAESPADALKNLITEFEKIKGIADSITTEGESDAINKIFKQISFFSTCIEKAAKDNLVLGNFEGFKNEFKTCVDSHTAEMYGQLADATEAHPVLATGIKTCSKDADCSSGWKCSSKTVMGYTKGVCSQCSKNADCDSGKCLSKSSSGISYGICSPV